MKDPVVFELETSIRVHSERLGYELVELNAQSDHDHLFLDKEPPKESISKLMDALKGKKALQGLGYFLI
jgi:REP element-mobilizing transposase RayT